MSLNEQQFFHGTNRPLDAVLPATKHGGELVHHDHTNPDKAYATTDEQDAWVWAEFSNKNSGNDDFEADPIRVYPVTPRGEYENDYNFKYGGNGLPNSGRIPQKESADGWDVSGPAQFIRPGTQGRLFPHRGRMYESLEDRMDQDHRERMSRPFHQQPPSGGARQQTFSDHLDREANNLPLGADTDAEHDRLDNLSHQFGGYQ